LKENKIMKGKINLRDKKILLIDDHETENMRIITELFMKVFGLITICKSIEEVQTLLEPKRINETIEEYHERTTYDLSVLDIMITYNQKPKTIVDKDYYLFSGLTYVVPILARNNIPIMIYTAMPKLLLSDDMWKKFPSQIKELPWVTKHEVLLSGLIKEIEDLFNNMEDNKELNN